MVQVSDLGSEQQARFLTALCCGNVVCAYVNPGFEISFQLDYPFIAYFVLEEQRRRC